MQREDGIYIGRHLLLSSLKACAKLKDIYKGFEVHTNIVQMGLHETDPVIGSALVDMYSKCNLLSRARQAFDKILVRDAVLWTTLMAGYVENGQASEVFKCLEHMEQENVAPDAVTYVCCLKACTSLGAVEKGQEIHDEVERKGLLEHNQFLGSTLVDMYVKYGSLVKARRVFDRLLNRDVVMWNALIQGYATHGHGEEALECLDKMENDGVSPDAVTFSCSLKACGSLKSVEKGRQIHFEIERKGLLQKDSILGNSVIDMYVKCGYISIAQQVLDKLPIRDVVSWTALIAGYGEQGYFEEALECFRQMQSEGVSPNATTFVCSLKACSTARELGKGREIHAEIERIGFLEQDDLVIGNALLDMYCKCGVLVQARQVFTRLAHQNVASWNTLLSGYADHDHGHEALKCFNQMQSEGFLPDAITFACSLKACSNTGAVLKGQEIHVQIEYSRLLESDQFVCSTLVDMYAKFGLLEKAQQAFDKLRQKDLVAWNALITGYSDHGCAEAAIECFEKLQAERISPNIVTYVCSLKACGMIGASNVGQEIHFEVVRMGFLENDHLIGNTLVDMYAKCGSLAKAYEVLCKLPNCDVATWNSLMAGYSNLGESLNVFHVLNEMLGEKIEPDAITFLIALNACSRIGFLDTSATCFETMSKDYGIFPTFKHHGCIVDCFSRTGELDQAIALTRKLSPSCSPVTWHVLLGACQTLGNVKLGKHAFKQLDCQDNIFFQIP